MFPVHLYLKFKIKIFLFQLIEFFVNRCQLQDAVMIAQAACEGYFPNALVHGQSSDLKVTTLKKESVPNGENYLQQSGPRYFVFL